MHAFTKSVLVVAAAIALAYAVMCGARRIRRHRQKVRSTFAAIVRELGMDPAAMRHTAGGGHQTDAQGRTWGTTTSSKPDDEYDMYRLDLRQDDCSLACAWTRGGDLQIVVRGIPETIASQLEGRRLSALIGPASHTSDLHIVETNMDEHGLLKVRARRT